jgi:alpha-D-xyloside xylohydrolase
VSTTARSSSSLTGPAYDPDVGRFEVGSDALEWRGGHEVVRLRPWGPDGIRVQAGLDAVRDDLPQALVDRPEAPDATIRADDQLAVVESGELRAELSADGRLRFARRGDGQELLAEEPAHFWWPGARLLLGTGGGLHRIEQRFRAYEGERCYGLGQHPHGRLDQKHTVIDLVQRNGEVTIPFLVSSRGYGFLWNNPATGRVELAGNGTRWVADQARQVDYWVVAGPPAQVLSRYAGVTGHPPELPHWATGFWQSKLRYRTQPELLEVAREYARRELPLSVIVCDFFHGVHFGDWAFDPADWPDPAAMVSELDSLGVKLMVSVWPTVTAASDDYRPMLEQGLLVRTASGAPALVRAFEKGSDRLAYQGFYDPTNPRAQEYVWRQVSEHYLRHGITVWWLDACEPELMPLLPEDLRLAAGTGGEVLNLYPRENARTFYEGMRAAGHSDVVTLNRSAWAGSQRYGAAVWSGDIPATFESLAAQVRAGLNLAMSGIPWWTTDIGGFHGGDPDDPHYRELMVRWFQYGVFCPITRLHGHRVPNVFAPPEVTGGPNEVWSYGEQAYQILREQLLLRERLRPYIGALMAEAARTGLPPMRPVFVDFPDDEAAWRCEDQFMFGPELLVCPVTSHGTRSRRVYLPAGTPWREVGTGAWHDGGAALDAAAPLDRIPVFMPEAASWRL